MPSCLIKPQLLHGKGFADTDTIHRGRTSGRIRVGILTSEAGTESWDALTAAGSGTQKERWRLHPPNVAGTPHP